jgi:hypothetical protein
MKRFNNTCRLLLNMYCYGSDYTAKVILGIALQIVLVGNKGKDVILPQRIKMKDAFMVHLYVL